MTFENCSLCLLQPKKIAIFIRFLKIKNFLPALELFISHICGVNCVIAPFRHKMAQKIKFCQSYYKHLDKYQNLFIYLGFLNDESLNKLMFPVMITFNESVIKLNQITV